MKRYNTLDQFFKKKFNSKIAKIPINAGFTCPNIDGSIAYGGCTFCSIKGSGDTIGLPESDLKTQYLHGKARLAKKWPNAKNIIYFQSFSNTYAPLDILKSKYEIFLNTDDIVGISIATRPDCLDDEIINYLGELAQKKYLLVEIGLQTSNESTGKLINRGHDNQIFIDSVNKLRAQNIDVCVHIINGLPNETYDDMIKTILFLNNLDIQGIKIHLLHVMQDTELLKQINNNFLKLLTKDEYIKIICDQLEILNPNIIIHRLTGDAPFDTFIGPIWSKKKFEVLNQIDQELIKRNSYQGKFYNIK